MTEPIASIPDSRIEVAPAGERESTAIATAKFSRSLRNVLWISSGSLITRIFNLLRGVILARLLTPFDFGVYGLGGSIVGIKERFADIGAGTFLVYRPKEIEEHTETAFWVNLALATVLLGILAAIAPWLAKLYREPLLTPVLVILALGVWARVNSSVHQNLLRAHSRFRALAIIDNCGSGAWLVVAVLLAWKGFGVWALTVSAAAASAILAVLLAATEGWRPSFRLSRVSLKLLGAFSFWYLGQGLGWFLVTNLDNLLVGRFLGMTLLGIYALAFNYALLPVSMVGNAVGNVAFAELPWLYDRPEDFWSAYHRFGKVLALVGCGVAFAGVVAAPDLFPLVFGDKWNASIVPFQILSVYAGVRCLWMDPFQALGNFRLSCLTSVGTAVAEIAALWFSMRFGLVGVACTMLAVQAMLGIVALLLVSRSWKTLAEAVRAAAPYFIGGAAAALATLELRRLVMAGSLEARIVVVILALGLYSCIYGLLFRKDLTAVLRQTLNRQSVQRA